MAARAATATSDTTFEALARGFIGAYLRLNPEEATQLGDHRYDGELSDYSPAAIARQTELLRKYLADLGRIDAAALTGANRVDAKILRLELESLLFALTEERAHAFDFNLRGPGGQLTTFSLEWFLAAATK